MSKIQSFQLRRWMMIYSLLIAVFGTVFFLLNKQFHFFPQSANWPVSIICVFIFLIACWRYQCTFCGEYPENTDVFMFDPKQCSNCGEPLK